MKKTVQARLDEQDIIKLKKEAKERGHTVSSFIRLIIKGFLGK